MTKRDYRREFISIAEHLYREGSPDAIEAAASHPLMQKASRYAVLGELADQMNDDDYREIFVLLGWEFDIGPDELCKAMKISEDKLAYDQA